MKRIRVRFPFASALLIAVLAAERKALSFDTWHEAEMYKTCILFRLNTHWLERTITELSSLVLRKPDDADYQTTLRHACVSPLASVHCAMKITRVVG